MTVIVVESARRVFPGGPNSSGKAAVDGVSLTLRPGRVAALLGPSGCGKSTLLRLIAGLEPLDGGAIRADERVLSGPGVHLPPERRGVGFVFQDYALFPHLRVLENVAFGLSALPRRDRDVRALQQLERVRLADRAKAWPQALSGGEQQRVALARALAPEPAVVLLDEPFSGLDGGLKDEVRETTLHALRAGGAAALIVTHDAEEALSMADDLALMQDGRLLQTGAPEDCYLRPASLSAARLLGETNELAATVRDGEVRTPFGSLPAAGLNAETAVVMARPEAFRLDPSGAETLVRSSRFRGAVAELALEAEGVVAHVHWPSRAAPRSGDRVRVGLDPGLCAVFPPEAGVSSAAHAV